MDSDEYLDDAGYDEAYLDDDEDYLIDDVGEEDDTIMASNDIKECPWTFLSNEEFVKELLRLVTESIGPYVLGDDEDTIAWKCLHLLRALDWNLGKVDEIADNQSKLCQKAGVLEEPAEMGEYEDVVVCTICEEKVDFSETLALECQHRFCKDCWTGFVSSTLQSFTYQQIFDNMKCMHRGCEASVLGPLIQEVLEEKDWQHYLRMLVKSFTEVNHATYSICPSCSTIAKANSLSSTVSKTVNCRCGNSYCFGCTMAPHVPASCIDLEKWKSKDGDEEASLNFIKATTTQCPKCGRALDRITACNHITCGCGNQFCFVCKQAWGKCSIYTCAKYKTLEEQQKAEGEFAPGYQTSSAWLVGHERYVAFSNKQVHAKGQHDKAVRLRAKILDKSLEYREAKPGGNPQFMIDGVEVLIKCWSIIQYTYVWGFFNIPPKICPQKNIYEWQVKNYEKLASDLEAALKEPAATIDHLKTKHLYTLIENSLIKKIEEAEDLLALFSEASTGNVIPQSVLARWTCPSCDYSNHPVEQEKACGHCSKPRPEVKILWFGTE
eukprot:TRINITY_DN572_c0_g1_i2.p1 TRINITY_DN572_c0_g1~~TRINITY_DN572_c0_g1_i2.p1  ORF type:complete len:570 (-),score=109.24 TRINITY_DN572_c0_g1_i2:110-1762(-)